MCGTVAGFNLFCKKVGRFHMCFTPLGSRSAAKLIMNNFAHFLKKELN
jgi:hypothetical protein